MPSQPLLVALLLLVVAAPASAFAVAPMAARSLLVMPLRAVPVRTCATELTAEQSEVEAVEAEPAEKPGGILGAACAVYRFSRPHTIRGTMLACLTGVGRALIETPAFVALLPGLLPRAMLGVLALLLGNLFIVGVNQIYDVDIDVINKPYLPIAAGRLTPRVAWAIVLGSGLAALGIVRLAFSPLIFWLFAFGTTVGGLYSVPPVQLKRFPLAAGLTIATCRGFLLNFGVYYATREARALWPRSCRSC